MRNLIFALLIFSTPSMLHAQGQISRDIPQDTPRESNDVPEKIRKQIAELSRGIMHGEPQFTMVGELEGSGPSYSVRGETFSINSDTVIYGELSPGAYVEVRGILSRGQPKIAKQIVVAEKTGGSPSKSNRSDRDSLLTDDLR